MCIGVFEALHMLSIPIKSVRPLSVKTWEMLQKTTPSNMQMLQAIAGSKPKPFVHMGFPCFHYLIFLLSNIIFNPPPRIVYVHTSTERVRPRLRCNFHTLCARGELHWRSTHTKDFKHRNDNIITYL